MSKPNYKIPLLVLQEYIFIARIYFSVHIYSRMLYMSYILLVNEFNLHIVLYKLQSEEIPKFEAAGLCRLDPFILDQPENNTESLWENCFN